MTTTQLAATAKTSPPDAARLDREVAESDVKRLTKAITELTRSGPGFDQGLHARLQVERESALQRLRAVDLEAAETVAAATGPLSPKVLEKIRLRRRRVEDWHSAVLARMSEHRRLREHLGRVKNEIATLEASWAFRQDQQELRNSYVFPRDPEARDNPAPTRSGQKTPKSMLDLAQFERDLATTAAELQIAVTVQAEAQARWESEKRTLDAWERAARSLGAPARAVLAALPAAGAATMGMTPSSVDFRDGAPGRTQPMIR